jgi:hypothetical protein
MAPRTQNRQESPPAGGEPVTEATPPREGRVIPWNCKVTRTELSALMLVAAARDVSQGDLIRSRGLNDIVREYQELVAKVARAS